MLDLLEQALTKNGLRFQRIDGTRTLQQRRLALTSFREDPSCTVLLASLGSAAVGLDLTAASHVHLVEPGWNPMLEFQALDRVHRIGQEKHVKTIRYVADVEDSIEKHILRIQQRKMELISSSFGDGKDAKHELKEALREFADVLRVKQEGNSGPI
ncbi:hypothetical protein K458DRAFT_350723 [Lentithecium fluviatile CBS 122367]|uniref:Helicase C-terminal domain-containing protein n=1 Tax=Lentithecium fluviatile CBS 122367 TaxID=1168545 RepID=A0A6G1IG24_9PLEO|nr:hypothetical protein K458DRAFT_350723 [Lentithecium fluviatile CBS 122367]